MRAYIGLLLLLGVSVGINQFDLGWGNMFLAVTIAAFQGAILAFVMMHALYEKALVRLVMAGSLVWFLILVTLTFTDYITRNWVPIAGK